LFFFDIFRSPWYPIVDVRELTKLQDEVGTFGNDEALSIFQRELGVNASEILDFESPDPIASASIGQVYKARLRSSGKTVAVKIQRPDVLEQASVDMFILRRLAAFGTSKEWRVMPTYL